MRWGRTSDCQGQEHDLSDIQRQREENGVLEPGQRPDVNAVYILPTTQRGEAGECGETDDRVDFESGEGRPGFANDGPNDESEPIEKVGETCERKESVDEGTTMGTSSDDDGGDRRGRCLRRRRAHEDEREGGEEDDAGREHAEDEERRESR